MKKSGSALRAKETKKQTFPHGWNAKKIQDVLDYYDGQSDAEGTEEYQAAMKVADQSVMIVPTVLVPRIRRLINGLSLENR